MQDDQVNKNLKGMDDLDFIGWNNADWHGVFAHHHTDDVLVDWKGQDLTRHSGTHRCHESIRRISRRNAAPDYVTPDRIRVRRMDMCHWRV